jgi:hypothetical protein
MDIDSHASRDHNCYQHQWANSHSNGNPNGIADRIALSVAEASDHCQSAAKPITLGDTN